MAPIRVLIVDDIARVRQDLRTLLPLAGEAAGLHIQVVGEAGDGQGAIQQAQELGPDVILMDLEMPGLDGFAATHGIKSRYPSIRIVALSVHGEAESRLKAHMAGADGFIEKGEPVETLVRAISGKNLAP